MEAALRTVYEKITGKKLLKIDFKKVRGTQGIKKAEVNINGSKVKIAAVNRINEAKKVLEELNKNPQAYDYIEAMACPGGCIGGGGQPIPVDAKIRKERAENLYKIDLKKDLRLAHKNPVLLKIYDEFFKGNTSKIHSICHTKYFKKIKK